MPDDPSREPPRVKLLRCLTCGNTVECKPADLLRFTRSGWLRCCGEVMTLFSPDVTPPGGGRRSPG
jgi:hypothetical protein